MKYDVLIIGGGPAGLTAAIYTARAELSTLVLAGQPAGGQLMLTSEVENFPGFEHGIQGPTLISNMRSQAARFKTDFRDENVTKIGGSVSDGFKVTTEEGSIYESKTIIVATGASARWLGLESETRLKGRGVSACATCDGFFFKDKVVAVVGAGDAAMEEATFLTKFASKVYLLIRSSEEAVKASVFMKNKAKSNSKVEFVFNTEVVEVLGESLVSGLRVKNNQTGQEAIMGDIQGLFLAIGHTPSTKFLEGFVDVGKGGYVVVTDNTRTNVEGVFVAGDVADYRYRQAITASGMGCMAALDAEKFLAHLHA
jgi:thioredoxin reductase (NADPH)